MLRARRPLPPLLKNTQRLPGAHPGCPSVYRFIVVVQTTCEANSGIIRRRGGGKGRRERGRETAENTHDPKDTLAWLQDIQGLFSGVKRAATNFFILAIASPTPPPLPLQPARCCCCCRCIEVLLTLGPSPEEHTRGLADRRATRSESGKKARRLVPLPNRCPVVPPLPPRVRAPCVHSRVCKYSGLASP